MKCRKMNGWIQKKIEISQSFSSSCDYSLQMLRLTVYGSKSSRRPSHQRNKGSNDNDFSVIGFPKCVAPKQFFVHLDDGIRHNSGNTSHDNSREWLFTLLLLNSHNILSLVAPFLFPHTNIRTVYFIQAVLSIFTCWPETKRTISLFESWVREVEPVKQHPPT